MKRYVIIDKNSRRKLSGCDYNDKTTVMQLKFRIRDWIVFPSLVNAQQHISFLKRICKNKRAVDNLRAEENKRTELPFS